MTLKAEVVAAAGDVARLEALYRQARVAGQEIAFRTAIQQCAAQHPGDLLLSAWTNRLDIQSQPSDATPDHDTARQSQFWRWFMAVAISVLLGTVSAMFARGKPPVPVPGEADPLFWIGFSPVTAMGVLGYLVLGDRSRRRVYWATATATVVLVVVLYTAVTAGSRADDIAILCAVHLPLFSLVAIGAAVVLGRPDLAINGYAFLIKALEITLAGCIFLAAGGVFLLLTDGIFRVLGINLAEVVLLTIGAWGLGAIPVLAVASAYDPGRPLVAQEWTSTGLTRILQILAQLILAPALGVLAVYDFWFIPIHFWRPFHEREVLFVYNATIMAILILLTVVVSGSADNRSLRHDTVLRYAVVGLGGLTVLLNAYALAAIIGRIVEFGLTPNRYAVFGWNVVTLVMFALVGIRLWSRRLDSWVGVFRERVACAAVVAAAWVMWVLIVLPLSFS